MNDDEHRLERWLAAAPVGVALLDSELRYLELNDAFARLTDHTAAHCVGRVWREVSPETAPSVEPVVQGVLDGSIADLELEARGRWYLASFFAVDGGVGAVAMDITSRKQHERELRDDLALREQVLAVVSHDLRSPLQAIVASASLLGRQLGEPVAKHVAAIHGSAGRVHRLVDDLLVDANIRAGGTALELARVPAGALVDEAVELLRPIAGDLRLERDAAVARVELVCDRLRVLQVFGNLVDNSLRHSGGGGPIEIGAEVRVGELVLFVRDHGTGISPDLARRLIAGTRVTALGLFICKAIVERHGGRIWIDSEPGRGATVWFTLPIAQ